MKLSSRTIGRRRLVISWIMSRHNAQKAEIQAYINERDGASLVQFEGEPDAVMATAVSNAMVEIQSSYTPTPRTVVVVATAAPEQPTITPVDVMPTIPQKPTLQPTPELWLAPGPYPAPHPSPDEMVITTAMIARYSHYWPPLGGANCHGDCDTMASGLYWEDYIGQAVACPEQFPFYTQFKVDGRYWTCLDRGDSIRFLQDGTFWLDFLEEQQQRPYWEQILVEVILP